MIMFENVIFICGLHRSGTTLLENYLYHNYSVASLRANVPENEGQFLQDVYKPAFHYGGPGKFAFSNKMQNDLANLTDYSLYKMKMEKSWFQFKQGEGDWLLEKSPPNITKMWWLRRVFPDAYFILWSRDPRAVSGATQKWSKNSLPELMMHWNVAYSQALNNVDSKTFILRYEDFCENPQQAIKNSGIDKILGKRSKPISENNRFSSIINSNQKYLMMHECKSYGFGVWRRFGYDSV